MGLSRDSVGLNALDTTFVIKKAHADDKVIALAGNPNVGKSTVFNELTGLRQHTGNWPGKTVTIVQGYYTYKQRGYVIVDLPGCYSLMARSAEEEAARDFICFGNTGSVILVCDATCLERSLNLVLQTLEITQNVVVCINLMDEAEKKKISINLPALAEKLGVPVVGTAARSRKGLDDLINAVAETAEHSSGNITEHSSDNITNQNSDNITKHALNSHFQRSVLRIHYPDYIEQALSALEPSARSLCSGILDRKSIHIDSRWLALMLLQQDLNGFEQPCELEQQKLGLMNLINTYYSESITSEPITVPGRASLMLTIQDVQESLVRQGIGIRQVKDDIVCSIVHAAEELCRDTVVYDDVRVQGTNPPHFDSTVDKLLTGKWTAFPLMILALMGIFWLTISGANYPSQVISGLLFWLENQLLIMLQGSQVPSFLYEMLILGVYRVLAWVVSVMLPPMAIFFPLFTLLEDVGFLPRIAFNLDKWFKKCSACGKQALTMCMGFGCNAAGVIGCRIIDSPRERLIAVLTNSFVPCNGRFPTLIAIISMFFVGTATAGATPLHDAVPGNPVGVTAASNAVTSNAVAGESILGNSLLSAVLLTAVIVLGVCMTFVASKFLSKTFLRGVASSFTLELPPYRKPQVGKVLARSVFDRTLFVLGRAVCVAAPAGLIIWLMANVVIDDKSLLIYCSGFLDPFARLLGMDGVILLAFILGFPANEIVLPIIIMAYMAQGNIMELDDLSVVKQLLVDNGWTWITAVSVMLFSLMHWPCSTACLTIKKETQGWNWTLLAFLLPTVMGMLSCLIFAALARGVGSLGSL